MKRRLADFEGATIMGIDVNERGGEVEFRTTAGVLRLTGDDRDGAIHFEAGEFTRLVMGSEMLATALNGRKLLKVSGDLPLLTMEYEGDVSLIIDSSRAGTPTYTLETLTYEDISL